ncbi:hypothetical protein [Streptomyces sp. 5-10]|uniref:hypothetical protein n=1 Tax=Streptomyces sp. 5-10 TaxID=878925 RepID=UPI00168BF9C7|nr:hypothetical protein [Streptomyces sp. 5-10]MBD3010838.1 hypothetical protein [Streptomyces sp. 5-10]
METRTEKRAFDVRSQLRTATTLTRRGASSSEHAPHVLESAAAAVRGALKKAAREQTTTSWARLEQSGGPETHS